MSDIKSYPVCDDCCDLVAHRDAYHVGDYARPVRCCVCGRRDTATCSFEGDFADMAHVALCDRLRTHPSEASR